MDDLRYSILHTMMRSRRGQRFLLGVGLVAALLLAFPLRGLVEEIIVRPLAYLLWMLELLYRAVPQPVVWVAMLVVMLYLAANSFSRKTPDETLPQKKPERFLGPVENLTRLVVQKENGIYFKWQIARMLSEVALDLQELNEHSRHRELDFPAGLDPVVKKYLDAGLNTSFADYPVPGGLLLLPDRFRKLPPTPFDTDLEPVVSYLESQLENQDDRRRP
jgi:hypothetical protein